MGAETSKTNDATPFADVLEFRYVLIVTLLYLCFKTLKLFDTACILSPPFSSSLRVLPKRHLVP